MGAWVQFSAIVLQIIPKAETVEVKVDPKKGGLLQGKADSWKLTSWTVGLGVGMLKEEKGAKAVIAEALKSTLKPVCAPP